MSLEKRIKEFAEQARGYLLEEFARSRKKDTEIVQWQGYNEDGKLLAKNKDLVPTVDGLGQKYATKGSDLILDSAGSVEQRKARRRQQEVAPERETQPTPPIPFVPRSADILLQFFDATAEFTEIYEVGDYILTYRKLKGDPTIQVVSRSYWGHQFYDEFSVINTGITFDVEVEGIDRNYVQPAYLGCNVDSCPPDSSTAQGMDEGDIFSVVLGEIHGSMLEWASSSTSRWTVKPNATMTVGSQTVSFTDQTPNLYGWARYIRRIVDYGVRQSVDFRVQGSMATPGGAQGTLEYQVETYSCFICDEAKYYYTFLNDGTAVTRTIDLAPMVQEGIYEHDKIHEYRTREIVGDKEEVIVYNVFYVDTIDTEYHWDVLDYEYASVGGTIDDGYKRWWGGVGKQVPYYIHTRLNLTTGQMSSRTTKCTVVAGLPKDGLFYVNDLDDPAGDFTLGWHHMTQETRDLMSPLFPFGAFVVYAISNSYVGFNFRHLTAQTPLYQQGI